MYDKQFPPNSGRLTQDHLADVAKRVGLDLERFTMDMQSPDATTTIQRDFKEGQAIGVTGTPAFIINGQPVIGAQPTAEFVKVIEQAAKQAH